MAARVMRDMLWIMGCCAAMAACAIGLFLFVMFS